MHLAALPLTSNGKIDRRLLPEPNQARPELEKKYASPRDAVELNLTQIWEEVLGVRPIGIEDRFFELGGHSLLAVRVIAQVEKVFGRKLRLATMFQAPTVEHLAAILREEIKEGSITAGTSLVEIQRQGTRPPLFLVHGAGGGMFWGYVNLSRHLGADQPVYGFKSHGLDGTSEYARIEDLAAEYIRDLKKVKPEGPYQLGGYCFGGNVAFEMARQLEESGEQVDFVALMNCAPPNSRYTRVEWSLRWFSRLLKNLLYWAKYVRQWSPSQRKEFFRWKRSILLSKLRLGRDSTPRAGANVDVRDLVDLSSYTPEQQQVWEMHIRALLEYHPQPFGGRVNLYRSPGHPLWCSFDPDYGWGDFAKRGVEVSIVPGAHEKILEEPCVTNLAESLLRSLNNGVPTAEHKSAFTPMRVLKGVIAQATLFWMASEAEVWQVECAGFDGRAPCLGSVLQHLGIFALGLGRRSSRKIEEQEAKRGQDTAIALSPARNGKAAVEGKLDLQRLELSIETTQKFAQLCRRAGATLECGLIAAVKVLLFRYANFGDSAPILSRWPEGRNGWPELRCAVNELLAGPQLHGNLSFPEVLHLLSCHLQEISTPPAPEHDSQNRVCLLEIAWVPQSEMHQEKDETKADLALALEIKAGIATFELRFAPSLEDAVAEDSFSISNGFGGHSEFSRSNSSANFHFWTIVSGGNFWKAHSTTQLPGI